MSARWPLIGRAEELALLTGLLRGDGRAVVLSGAAGVGKSRLAAELLRESRSTGRETVWLAASRALAGIPFGVFAPLLTAGDGTTGGAGGPTAGRALDVLRRVHDELRRRGPDRPVVLGVDDAHLLDEPSAGLVHQLAVTGTALVVVTLRADEPVPAPIRALWKDGVADRVELRPLSRTQVGDLLAAALDGQVDSATAHRLWQVSEGNALLLRELVLLGTGQRRLACRHGVWSWRGELGASGRLAELIDERLAGLGATQRSALEVLAVGEPLPVTLFERIVGDQVAALDATGLLDLTGDSARMAHPLYAEAVRARLRPLRRRDIYRALGRGARAGECDVLRLAGWQLDGSADPNPDMLTNAAQRSAHLGDHALAERLARAAVPAGGRTAGLALAEALQAQNRFAECRTELDRLDMRQAEPVDRARWALLAAGNATWADADADAADAILRRAQQGPLPGDLWDELAAQRVENLAYGGRPTDALAVARPAMGRGSARADTQLRLARASVLALAILGQTGPAIAIADEVLGDPPPGARERPFQLAQVVAARLHAYCHAGRYVELEAEASAYHERVVEEPGPSDLQGLVAFLWGRALLGRGAVERARTRLREAAALLREHDSFGQLSLLLATLARVEAQRGDSAAAEAAMAECDQRVNRAIRVCEPYFALARAWVASAAAQPRLARASALHAADLAGTVQCATVELEALHEAVRLGEPGLAERLARVAARVDCAPAADYVAHAAALARRDGPELDACAARFAEAGLLLLAAEASVEAAAEHARNGHRSAELAALDRAHRWAAGCEGARTPVLMRGRPGPVTAWLTTREREIAELAVRGLSDADIAERLVLSRRTVGNHLGKVYGKLGVSGRTQLGDCLMPYVGATTDSGGVR